QESRPGLDSAKPFYPTLTVSLKSGGAPGGLARHSRRMEALLVWSRWGKSAGVSLLAMLTMVVAACGGTTPNNSPTLTRSGTITIWHHWEGTYLDAKKAIFDAYSKQYPNVTINLGHKPDLTSAVTTAVPA